MLIEEFDAVMRRWVCISRCLELLSDKDREILLGRYMGSDLPTLAKKLGNTREGIRQRQESIIKKMMQMIAGEMNCR